MEFPQDFRCPISMELMNEPVIISTGVTYERKNIEKWFYSYKKKTCPATMQIVEDFGVTPNHTLKRLILAWQNSYASSPSCSSSTSLSSLSSFKQYEMVSLIQSLDSTPFKVNVLRKLREIIEMGDEMKLDFVILGGLKVLFQIIVQILFVSSDFMVFRACEEALGVLQRLPIFQDSDGSISELFLRPELLKSMIIILQRGSKEARVSTISILKKLANSDFRDFSWNDVLNIQGIGMIKSLLELASDDISTKLSSSSLQVLIKILDSSKKSRTKAIEVGAMFTLIELLPDSNRSKCEKILHIIKLLCECTYGKVAFMEHDLAVGVVSSKMFNVSDIATKICIKIFLLTCSSCPTTKVLEDMMIYGAVKKLVVLMHMSRPSSTKDKMVVMFRNHSNFWSRYPCFPSELKEYQSLKRT